MASTLVWYLRSTARALRVGLLCWMFWGASLMWLVDAVFAYAELGAACFTPAPAELLDGLFLRAFGGRPGLVIWLAALLIRDPKGVLRQKLSQK